MRVAVLIPIRGYEKNFYKLFSESIPKVVKNLKLLGATEIHIRYAGIDTYFFPSTNETHEKEPKGKGIIGSLRSIPEPPHFVIVCDGSEKIPLAYIPDVFQELISDSTLSAVMACRGEHKAISKFRYLVERFEVFSLKRYHKYDNIIPDGQCGLWGYRYGKIKINDSEVQIKLTGLGYEIELDLLDEVLNKKLKYSFMDVELPTYEVKTSYDYDDNIQKMKFLCGKNEKLKDSIPLYLEEFEETDEFERLLTELEDKDKEIWNEKYKKDIHNFAKSSE